MIGIIVGCILGGTAGFLIGAVMSVGSDEDDNMFDDEEIR